MKKEQLLNLLNEQANQPTTKTTRKDIIKVVAQLVEKHIKDNADVYGISTTRKHTNYVNLGDVVEIVAKSIFNNDLHKNNNSYDVEHNGEKVEVKFATSDAYAHKINKNNIVDYYLIITYTKALGGMVFKVPYTERQQIKVNKQGRVITNQLAKYIDNDLTKRVFH